MALLADCCTVAIDRSDKGGAIRWATKNGATVYCAKFVSAHVVHVTRLGGTK